MYFYTHLYMAKVLYRHLSKEIKLDKRAFSYGNIKPDLPSPTRTHHTIEKCLNIVSDKVNSLLEEETSSKEFSLLLGEICHYVCDFCCYHHLNEEVHNKRFLHFTYELRLHWKLFTKRYQLSPVKQHPKMDIAYIVQETRKSYLEKPRSMQTDIDSAFTSAAWAAESVIFYVNVNTVIADEAEGAFNTLLLSEGGSI